MSDDCPECGQRLGTHAMRVHRFVDGVDSILRSANSAVSITSAELGLVWERSCWSITIKVRDQYRVRRILVGKPFNQDAVRVVASELLMENPDE